MASASIRSKSVVQMILTHCCCSHCLWGFVFYAVLSVFLVLQSSFLPRETRLLYLNCLPDVLWLLAFFGSSSWCCGLVCSVWLRYFGISWADSFTLSYLAQWAHIVWKLQHKIQISAMTLESKIKVKYDKCLTIASEFLHIKHTDCLWCVVKQRFQITDMT